MKEKLIALRKSKKISQINIAVYLKISQPQYYKREAGIIQLTIDEWQKIAKFMGVKVEDIYEDTPLISTEEIKNSIMEELSYLKEKINALEQKISS